MIRKNIPKPLPGHPVSAENYGRIVDFVNQSGGTGPARYVNGAFDVSRPLGVTAAESGGAAAGQRVMVYDDPRSAAFSGGVAQYAAVRCLPIQLINGVATVQTAGQYINAYPASSQAVDLDAEGCCGGSVDVDAGPLSGNLTITTPIAANNRVDAGTVDETAFRVTGRCNPTCDVLLTLTGGSSGTTAINTPDTVVTPDAAGDWSSEAINLSSVSGIQDWPILIKAQVRLPNGVTTLPARYAVVGYDDRADTQSDSLVAASYPLIELRDDDGPFTGSTNDTTPIVRATYPVEAVAPDLTGPGYRIDLFDELNGHTVVYSGVNPGPFDDVRVANYTAATALGFGQCTAVWTAYRFDGGNYYFAGPSRPVWFNVVDSEAEPEEEPAAVRYARTGWLLDDADGNKTVFLDGCRHPMSAAEIAKLDGTVTATAQATADFDTGDATIPFDSFAITDDPSGLSPSPPSSPFDQPDPVVEGLDNALLTFSYENSAWRLVSVGAPVEE